MTKDETPEEAQDSAVLRQSKTIRSCPLGDPRAFLPPSDGTRSEDLKELCRLLHELTEEMLLEAEERLKQAPSADDPEAETIRVKLSPYRDESVPKIERPE